MRKKNVKVVERFGTNSIKRGFYLFLLLFFFLPREKGNEVKILWTWCNWTIHYFLIHGVPSSILTDAFEWKINFLSIYWWKNFIRQLYLRELQLNSLRKSTYCGVGGFECNISSPKPRGYRKGNWNVYLVPLNE